MDRMLYIAMTGAKQNMLAQAINANNLANISTTGFREDLAAARSMPLYGGDGYPTRAYVMTEKPGIDFSQGSMSTTGRDLDVAVNGRGFIAVQSPKGTEAYTRAGDLKLDSAGVLHTGAGHIVLGEGGPITIPASSKIEIGRDGTVSIVAPGAGEGGATIVDKIKLVNPDEKQLKRDEHGLFVLKNGENAASDAEVTLISGTVETSNVNAAAALVNMIELARQFEMQVKMMKSAEENDSQAAQMMRLG
jgi:flagellar basal-body rod protein FlgF